MVEARKGENRAQVHRHLSIHLHHHPGTRTLTKTVIIKLIKIPKIKLNPYILYGSAVVGDEVVVEVVIGVMVGEAIEVVDVSVVITVDSVVSTM